MNTSDLKPHTFYIRRSGCLKYEVTEWATDGYLVPETNNLLAIDARYSSEEGHEGDWCITHLPTGWNLGKYAYHETLEKAVKFAQGFYREFQKIGDLNSKDIEAIVGPWNSLSQEQRDEILKRID